MYVIRGSDLKRQSRIPNHKDLLAEKRWTKSAILSN